MLPISKIALLPEDIRLNPFDVYIIIDYLTAKAIEEQVKEIWDSLSFLPAVFNIRFVDRENLLENFEEEKKFVKLFSESNIFASVIGPRTTHIRIEIANIEINLNDRSETEIELFLFFLQLCKSNMEVLQNMRMELEYFDGHPDSGKKIEYLTAIENNFKEIEHYLKEKLKGEYLYRIQPRKRNTPIYGSSRDRLRFLSIPVIDHIKETEGDLSDIEIKASSLGIDVPPYEPKIDSEIKILIKEEVGRSKFPGLVIQKGGKEVVVPCGFTEGIFIYTCTLLFKIEDKEYRKKDFMDFLDRVYDYKGQDKILIEEMPGNLKKEYLWYEDVFNALFQEREADGKRFASYKGNLSFENWILALIRNLVKSQNGRRFTDRDPFRQGIYRVRKNLNNSLKRHNLSSIFSKVNLDSNIRDKGKPYKLYIDKDNIFFPDNEKWGKVVSNKSHFKDTSSQKVKE